MNKLQISCHKHPQVICTKLCLQCRMPVCVSCEISHKACQPISLLSFNNMLAIYSSTVLLGNHSNKSFHQFVLNIIASHHELSQRIRLNIRLSIHHNAYLFIGTKATKTSIMCYSNYETVALYHIGSRKNIYVSDKILEEGSSIILSQSNVYILNLRKLLVLSCATHKLKELHAMKKIITNRGLCCENNYIYSLGGEDDEIDNGCCADQCSNYFEKFNICARKWIEYPHMRYCRVRPSCLVIPIQYIYVFGDDRERVQTMNEKNIMERYNFQTSRWEEIVIKLPGKILRSSFITFENKSIYICGCYSASSNKYIIRMEKLINNEKEWKTQLVGKLEVNTVNMEMQCWKLSLIHI